MPRAKISSDSAARRLEERGLEPRWLGAPPGAFGRVRSDSRIVEPGDLFCAVPGTRVDGHDFVEAAVRAGAAAVVAERVTDVEVPHLLVADARRALSHLAALFSGDPGDLLRLAGITGTNGKTTTAWLVRWLLAGLEPSATIGTLGLVGADGRTRPGSLTTPDPIDLAEMLAALVETGVRSAALEVSSHALHQHRVDALRFASVAFTSFSREHLEYHADMEDYRATKLRLLDLLEPGGVCAVNADEPAWRDVAPAGAKTLRYGLDPTADVGADSPRFEAWGTAFELRTPDGTAEVMLPLPAEFNVRNALAAAAMAFGRGLSTERIAERLTRAPAVPGRMEVLAREPVLVVRDYAHTPDAYERVLATLRELVRGRLVAVFGCGGDRDPGKRPLMGEAATRGADLAIVTTDNPRSEDPAEICRQVVAGLDPSRYRVVLDRRDAIEAALAEAGGEAGGVVLLGKGHETYQVIGDRRLPFDEASIVAELAGVARPAPEPQEAPE